MIKTNDTPIFISLFILCTAIFLIPVWLFRFLPLVDYPQHLAIAHIFHNYGNEGNLFQDYYRINFFPVAYMFHTIFLHIMSFVFPMEIAGKLYLSLYIILLPISVLSCIKAYNGEKWFCFFAFLFIYNFPFLMGFMAYFMAVPFFFLNLAALTHYAKKKGAHTRAQGILLAGLFFLSALTHPILYYPAILFSIITLIFVHKKNIKGYKTFLWILPSLIFMIYYFINRWGLLGISLFKDAGGISHLMEIITHRLKNYGLHLLWPLHAYNKIIGWFFLSVSVVFLYGFAKKRKVLTPLSPLLFIWLILSLLTYLTIPDAFSHLSYIGTRFAILAPILLILALSAIKLKPTEKTLLALCLTILLGVTVTKIIPGFYDFNHRSQPLPGMINILPKNKKVIGLYYPQGLGPGAFHPWAYMHLGCYYTIWKDSIPVYVFADDHIINIIEKRQHITKWGDHPFYKTWHPHKMIIPEGWQNYDYFLACGNVPDKHRDFFKDHHIDLLREEGIWSLYKAPGNSPS